MKLPSTAAFILQSIGIGALAVTALWLVKPEWVIARASVAETPLLQSPVDTKMLSVSAHAPASYADAVEPAARAVVNIYTAKIITRYQNPLMEDPVLRHFFGHQAKPKKEVQSSLGSGVIVSNEGYVLTNNHIIAGADEIQILLNDGRRALATVVGADKDTDLAVLHITMDNLPVLPMGDSQNVRVGDIALAIGNPFGVGQTVTLGIVSATGRNHLGISRYEDFIQTDAAINPGNSGGALINARGELIGINSAIYSKSGGSQGIGFSIPVALAQHVMTQLIEQGHVQRGWIGIEAQDITSALAQSFGLKDTIGMLIAGVLRTGPADKGGIKPGDVIKTISGKRVEGASDAIYFIAQKGPGIELVITGLRNGKPFSTQVTTTVRPEPRLQR
ncbi:MAG: trypsin-like peptidase domain-containing protein [Gammaproteobacteria bacterium]